MYSAPREVLLLNVKDLKSLVMEKRKQPLDSMFQNPVPQAARALLAIDTLGVAGIQMLALFWALHLLYSAAGLSTNFSAPAPTCCLTATYFRVPLLHAGSPLGQGSIKMAAARSYSEAVP